MKNRFLITAALFVALLSAGTVQAQVTTRSSTTRTGNNSEYTHINSEYDSASATQRLTIYKNGEVYKVKVVNDKITEIFINDKKIAESDFGQYESMINRIREQIKKDEEQAARDRAQAALDRKQAEKDREQAEKDRAQAMKDRAQAELDRKQAEKDRARAEEDRKQHGKDVEQAEKDRAQAVLDRKQADKDRAQAELDRAQAVKDRAQAEKDREQAVKDRAQAEIDRKRAAEDRKLLADLIEDLIKENIIKSNDDLGIVVLSNESLIVNDKVQSAELHRQFKSKYLKTPNTRLIYSRSTNNTNFSIERN